MVLLPLLRIFDSYSVDCTPGDKENSSQLDMTSSNVSGLKYLKNIYWTQIRDRKLNIQFKEMLNFVVYNPITYEY